MMNPPDRKSTHATHRGRLVVMLIGWACLFLLVATGCRRVRDNQFDILERELRTQEDYIYELEDYVVEYSEKLRQLRCEQQSSVVSSSSESKSDEYYNSSDDDRRIEPLRIDEAPSYEPDEVPEQDDLPELDRATEPPPLEIEATTPEEFDIPELEISEPLGHLESAESFELAASEQEQLSLEAEYVVSQIPDPAEMEPDSVLQAEYLAADLPPMDLWDDASQSAEQPEIESAEPTEMEIDPTVPAEIRSAERVVIAQLFRSEPGVTPPKTMLAVVETRDADDEPVEFLGSVSLMVMASDPEKPQRLKRWDFNLDDAAAAWQSSRLGDGLHLELPLGETELPEVPLELWVRIVDPEGRKLLSQLPFQRQQLLALEAETGARELVADADAALQLPTAEQTVPVAEEAVLVTDEKTAADQAEQQTGWRTATQRTDLDAQGYGSTVRKPAGWAAQPSGGRFSQKSPTTTQRTVSTRRNGPVWTTDRVSRTARAKSNRRHRPQWSPRR